MTSVTGELSNNATVLLPILHYAINRGFQGKSCVTYVSLFIPTIHSSVSISLDGAAPGNWASVVNQQKNSVQLHHKYEAFVH